MKPSRFQLLAVLLLAPACSAGGGSVFIGDVSCGAGGSSASVPAIQLIVPDGKPAAATIQVRNLGGADAEALRRSPPPSNEEWQALLRITVAPVNDVRKADAAVQPAVAGSYAVHDDAVVFTPMFGFDPGRRYRATFDRTRLPSMRGAATGPGDLVEAELWLPKPDVQPTTLVDHIYPTSDLVPENQLRLYVHFSAPMGLKGGLDYISLLDESGSQVRDPFLPLDAELWNGDRTRFTVFFDPGRVKRGILPNKEMGRSLTEGHAYTLVVSREWRDGQGLPLKEEFRRTFKVGPPDDKPLDQRSWRIQAPRAGSRAALAVAFPEPLDHGLLLRALGVSSPAGAPVDGDVAIDPGEKRWAFTPRQQWTAGNYRLRVLSILEDLAGNRIGRPFEVDQFERADRQPEPEEISIAFEVRN